MHTLRQKSQLSLPWGVMEADATRNWRKLAETWQGSFPLDLSNTMLGSWLDAQDEPWGIGCEACRSAGGAGNVAKYMVNTERGVQQHNLAKHTQSFTHINTDRRYLPVAVSATAGSSLSC